MSVPYSMFREKGYTELESRSLVLAFLDDLKIPLKIEKDNVTNLEYHCFYPSGTKAVPEDGWDYLNKSNEVMDSAHILKERIKLYYDDDKCYEWTKYFDFAKKAKKKHGFFPDSLKISLRDEDFKNKLIIGDEFLKTFDPEYYNEQAMIKKVETLSDSPTSVKESKLTIATNETIMDIKSLASLLNRKEEAEMIIQETVDRYKNITKESYIEEGIKLGLIPISYDLSLQALFVELYTYYLKLLDMQIKKNEQESKIETIAKFNQSNEKEDLVGKTIDETLVMAKHIGKYDEANGVINKIKERLATEFNRQNVLMDLFKYYSGIKTTYDKYMTNQSDLQKFENLKL